MILVDVYIPSIDDTYDFMLDENISVDRIILEMTGIISKKMRNDVILDTENFFLYSMKEKKLLKKNLSLFNNGVRDGSQLMLV
jgi:hypothetical protein